MAIQIDWGLARTPDFTQNALQSYQQGQQMGRQQATQSALKQYATDPEGSINALTGIDPVAASQLRQARVSDLSMQRQDAFRAALTKGDMLEATKAAAGDPALMQSLGAVQTHMKSLNDAQAAGLQAVAGIKDPAQRAQVWDTTVAPGLVQLGMDPNQVSSKSGNIDFSDDGIKAAVGKTMTAKDQIDLAFKGSDLKVKRDTQVEAARHDTATEGQQAATLKETTRHNSASEKTAAVTAAAAASNATTARDRLSAETEGSTLASEALDYVAQQYRITGQLPPLGMGKAAARTRQQVIARAAELDGAAGRDGADAAATHADTKAAISALQAQSRATAAIQSFEDTARANGQLAADLAGKGAGPSGSPIINRWMQNGRKQILGDPDVTKFDIALGTYADEYAKVTTGNASGSGSATSDAARREAYDRLSKYATKGQLAAGFDIMNKEMANRTAAQQSTLNDLRKHIHDGAGKPTSAAAPAPLSADKAAIAKSVFGF